MMRKLHKISSIEIGKMSEDNVETKQINDYVFSLYQRKKITLSTYMTKLRDIENADDEGGLMTVSGMLII